MNTEEKNKKTVLVTIPFIALILLLFLFVGSDIKISDSVKKAENISLVKNINYFNTVLASSYEELFYRSYSGLKLFGDAAIKVYVIQGDFAYSSIKDVFGFVYELGEGALSGYQLAGIIYYEGIKGSSSYSLRFLNKFNLPKFNKSELNLNQNLESYLSDVSSGAEIVKGSFSQDFAEPLNKSFNSFMGNILNNFSDVYEGFQYLSEKTFEVPVSGFKNSAIVLATFSEKFVTNIKNNLMVINESLVYMTSSVWDGFTNLFSLDLLQK